MDFIYFCALYMFTIINVGLIIYALRTYHYTTLQYLNIYDLKVKYQIILTEIIIIETKNAQLELKIKILEAQLKELKNERSSFRSSHYHKPYLILN